LPMILHGGRHTGGLARGRLFPAADQAADLGQLSGGVLIPAVIDAMERMRQPEQVAQLVDGEVGGLQGLLSLPVIGRLDQAFEGVE